MLTSLRNWIEDLFRPVITVKDSGSYLERTPTVLDIGIHRNPRLITETITLGAPGEYTSAVITVPSSRYYILDEVIISNSVVGAAPSLTVFMDGAPRTRQSVAAAVVGSINHNATGNYQGMPVIVPPGHTFNAYGYAANGTYILRYWITEVYL